VVTEPAVSSMLLQKPEIVQFEANSLLLSVQTLFLQLSPLLNLLSGHEHQCSLKETTIKFYIV
jgi:hypothetical protein